MVEARWRIRGGAWPVAGGLLLCLAAAQAREIVSETFDSPPASWQPPAAWQVRDGGLQVSPNASHERLILAPTAGLADSTVSVTVRQIAGDPGSLRVGLLFRAADPDHGYFALIRADGAYWLGKLSDGTILTSQTGFVAAVRPDGPNTLAVTCDGGRQTLSINGVRLVSRTDGSYAQGAAGLWAAGTGTAVFDDLTVTTPNGTTSPVAPTPPIPPLPGGRPQTVTTAVPPMPGVPRGSGAAPEPAPEQPGGLSAPGLAEPSASPRPLPAAPSPEPPEPTVPAPLPPEPVVPAPPAPATPAAGEVLFEESFDPPTHRWNLDAFRRIEAGEMRLQAEEGFELSGFPYAFGDYAYQARARALSETGGTYGIVARLQDDSSGYLFVVRDPDVYAVARLDAGKPTLLRRGQSALPRGWKLLELRCSGPQLECLIDGRPVATVSDPTYPRGGVGLWVDNHREAAFDDLMARSAQPGSPVVSLPPQPEVPPPTPGGDPDVLLNERFEPSQMAWQQDAQREILDGAMVLTAPRDRFVVSGVTDSRFIDYVVTLAVERLSDARQGLFGLLVRMQPDGRTGYLFALTGATRFVALRVDAGEVIELARGEAPLRDGVNTITARCTGDGLTFQVNATTVVSVRDATYPAGGFGLYVDNGVRARFDNILATVARGQR